MTSIFSGKRALLAVFPAALILFASGCGGGGGGSTPSPAGRATGQLTVFATDAFSDTYDQVWVKIHRVELLDATGAAETVFDDAGGLSLNLKTLHDSAGQRFFLLTHAVQVRSRLHTQVRVTLDNGVALIPAGASAGQTFPVTDNAVRDASGRPMLTFPLSGGSRNLGAGDEDLAIDFDLTTFTVVNGKVVPTLREGEHSSLRGNERQEASEVRGVVSQITGSAPNVSFVLTQANGTTFTVQTGAATATALANGKSVEVRGIYDVSSDRFVASVVKIENSGISGAEAKVEGTASAVDAAGTFLLTAGRVRGFLPTQTTVRVVTNSSTVFRSDSGLPVSAGDFYASLPGVSNVEAEGTYDAASNTLTAATISGGENSGGENSGDDKGGESGSHH